MKLSRPSPLAALDTVYFKGRFIYRLSRFLLKKFIHDVCLLRAEHTIRKSLALKEQKRLKTPNEEIRKAMSKRLPLNDKRKWYSPKDIEDVYGFSRKTLELIRRDAAEEGMPLKVSRLTFRNGSATTRKRPCIRISRKSLEAYLEAHLER